MDVATIKGVIDRLTARGLTETSPDPEDGRRLLVSLTRAGQQLAEKAAPNALAITRETLAPLDAKERETLMGLLEQADGETIVIPRRRSCAVSNHEAVCAILRDARCACSGMTFR